MNFSGANLPSLVFGLFLGGLWLYRMMENIAGMPRLPDLSEARFAVGPECKLPSLRVIVPARNEEAAIEQCLRSLFAVEYDALEIVAIDDRSTDRTGVIMDSVAALAGLDRLRVIHVKELPAGWLGKTHAMWLGAEKTAEDERQASNRAPEWLLFTDGDTLFHPESLRRAVAYAETRRADHFVLLPTMIMPQFGERMMISFFHTMFVPGYRPGAEREAAFPWSGLFPCGDGRNLRR